MLDLFTRMSFEPEELRRKKRKFFWIGLLMILVGICAVIMPLTASYAIETVLGVSLLIAGAGRLWTAFTEKSWMQVLLMILCVVSGVVMLTRPFVGMITLGSMLAAYFLIGGIAKCLDYFRFRDVFCSFGVFLSGLIDVFLAFIIWDNLFSAASAPGVLLGVNLIITGVSMMGLSWGCRRFLKMMDASHNDADSSIDVM
jgi:uncharacterized membrane protein HdeD (DUF308 family)